MLTSEDVKRRGRELGADLVGIGSLDRYEGAPTNGDPRFIFPEAKSMIGLGFRIHRGLLRGIEEGVLFGAYAGDGYANVNNVHMPVVLRELGSWIEDHGWEAVLHSNGAPRFSYGATGKPVREGYPQPDVFVHLRIAGIICGMGEIGWSKVFLSPQFGPRQRLAFILTDAELEPDPLVEPGTLCDRCMRCVKECPAQALRPDLADKEEVTIAGKTYSWGKLKESRCAIGWQAANPEKNPFLNRDMDPQNVTTRRILEQAMALPDSPENDQYRSWVAYQYLHEKFRLSNAGWTYFHHPGAVCGAACMRTCMVHLEEQGKLENKFHNRFRIRKPWKMDYSDENPSAPTHEKERDAD